MPLVGIQWVLTLGDWRQGIEQANLCAGMDWGSGIRRGAGH